MKVSVPFIAKELKAELKKAGVKVLRCKQANGNAIVTIVNEAKNVELFETFAKENNYAGSCGLELKNKAGSYDYVDYGNVFKYMNVA